MDHTTFVQRRQQLRASLAEGAILIMGAEYAPRNFKANVYPFRQDSHFLYYAGVSHPGMAALMLPDGGEVLYGTPEHPDDLVWFGPHLTLSDHAAAGGFDTTAAFADLGERLGELRAAGVKVHYLPPYRGQRTLALASLLGITPGEVVDGVSRELVMAVTAQRSVKSALEVAEIENALGVTAAAFRAAMAAARPGRTEAQVAAAFQAVAMAKDRQMAFPPIVTVHGEVLHNESYANTLADGDLMVIDSGSESVRGYASDITRTFPVSGRFQSQQAEIYEVVLRTQLHVIESASPERSNRELHMQAVRDVAAGLNELGLMKGDVDEAVAAGAHALFMPHGIGHMMGLDVHDMEDLGDVVGYDEGDRRSEQFGLCNLRLAKQLEPGYVITVEPGIYFIPALIERWRSEGKFADFVNYDRLDAYRGFGGIRIEDNVLITATGCRVLGPGIPKTIAEVEAALQE